ncbi:MAG: hypothetical protein OWS74_04805, partial [Firmicutes bacterium]|nr:hypothetical protein [Bacillota bacterium]
ALRKIRALGMQWLGRLPATFGLCSQLKDQAWATEAPWEPLGTLAAKPQRATATYQAHTFDTTLYDQPARAFVYYSSALDKKKEHTLQREIAREAQTLEKTAKKLAQQVFHCREDAATASETWVRTAKIRWHTVTPTLVSTEISVRPRGRQKAGTEPPKIWQYTVQWHWTGPTPEVVQAERERRPTFVLITSQLTCDARTALHEYKAQDQDEHGFRWMKSPMHLSAFFLEKPTRIVGLGYLLLLALQFARFMRAMVRLAMIDQPPLELPDHRKIARPSETVILDALRTLWVERKEEDAMVWYQWIHVKPHVGRILEMLQIPIQHRFQWDASS